MPTDVDVVMCCWEQVVGVGRRSRLDHALEFTDVRPHEVLIS